MTIPLNSLNAFVKNGQSSDDYSKGTKADPVDLGYQLLSARDSHSDTRHILSNLLPDTPITEMNEGANKRKKRKGGLSR